MKRIAAKRAFLTNMQGYVLGLLRNASVEMREVLVAENAEIAKRLQELEGESNGESGDAGGRFQQAAA